MLKPEIQDLVNKAAAVQNLPPDLVRAEVMVESSGNPDVEPRYEPAFQHRYLDNKPIPHVHYTVTLQQEKQQRATSWGLMQIMGESARELGYGRALKELQDPALSLQYGCKLLAQKRDKYFAQYGWPGVVAAYNGGNVRLAEDGKHFENQGYVDKVLAALGGNWPHA